MARLVRKQGGVVEVARGRVYNAEYGLIYVDQVGPHSTLPHGWTYFTDNVETSDFLRPWRQPLGAHDAYEVGDTVEFSGEAWRSTIKGNVWQPGVTGWQRVSPGVVPDWRQPLGAHDAYVKGSVVVHAGESWASEVDANVWEPGVHGWRRSLITPPAEYVPGVTPPAWVQPTGAHDAYAAGSRVSHNGMVWVSSVDANVWEPGVYGWAVE